MLQLKRWTIAQRVNAGVYRQLSNAYLYYSNVNILPTAINAIVARPAVLVGGKPLFGRLGLETQPTKAPKTPGLASPTQAETAAN